MLVFWLKKIKMMNREKIEEIEELVGEGYVKRLKGTGLVVMEWEE